jgi:hypothetical protein
MRVAKVLVAVLCMAAVMCVSFAQDNTDITCLDEGADTCRACCQRKLEAGTIASDPTCSTPECNPFLAAGGEAPAPDALVVPVPEPVAAVAADVTVPVPEPVAAVAADVTVPVPEPVAAVAADVTVPVPEPAPTPIESAAETVADGLQTAVNATADGVSTAADAVSDALGDAADAVGSLTDGASPVHVGMTLVLSALVAVAGAMAI